MGKDSGEAEERRARAARLRAKIQGGGDGPPETPREFVDHRMHELAEDEKRSPLAFDGDPAPAISSSMQLDRHWDHVQLRDGTALLGEVLNEAFTVKSVTLGELKVESERIISIVLRDASTGPEDRVILKDGDQVFGTILDSTLEFRSDGLGEMSIALTRVLAVQLTF